MSPALSKTQILLYLSLPTFQRQPTEATEVPIALQVVQVYLQLLNFLFVGFLLLSYLVGGELGFQSV